MKKIAFLFLSILFVALLLVSCKEQHEHSYARTEVSTQPTCTEDGIEIDYCQCGCVIASRIVKASGHDYSVVNELDSTCTSVGYTDTRCNSCGDSTHTEIPMKEHNFEHECYPYCSSCYEYYSDLASNHSFVYPCIPDCSVCGYYYNELAADHTYDNEYDGDCNVCGQERTAAECPHINLDVTREALEPTCTDAGYTVEGYCRDCKTQVVSQSLKPLGHEWNDEVVTSEPTCLESGIKTFTCVRGCTDNRIIDALGHSYDSDGFCVNCSEHITFKELAYVSNGDGTCSVSKGICKRKLIVIPEISPEGDIVTSILYGAFKDCDELETVIIPDSVTKIENSAFYGTALYLNTDNWENEVLYIGKHLIEAKQTISGEYSIKSGTLTVADYAFSDCDSLASVNMASSVTHIGYRAFYSSRKLESVNILEGTLSIAEEAFYYCYALSTVSIPDSVINIGRRAFEGTQIYENYDNWEDGVLYIGHHLIKVNDDEIPAEYTIKDGTLTIAASAFSESDIASLHKNLTSITIPASVTTVNGGAFNGHEGLENVIFAEDSQLKTIGAGSFAYTSALTSISIPEGVTYIGTGAFWNSILLTRVDIPSTVTYIGDRPFSSCWELTEINVSDGNTKYKDIDGNLYSYDGKTLITYTIGKQATAFEIPDGVTTIGSEAFEGCEALTSVTIPKSVKYIEDHAFSGCTALEDFTVPDNAIVGINAFHSTAFYNDESNWENGILYVGKHLVDVDGATGECVIKEGTLTIASGAFWGSNFTSVVIPDSVTVIGELAFYGASLNYAKIGNGVTVIGDRAFYWCVSLQSIVIGKNVEKIGGELFIENVSLSRIYYVGTYEEWCEIDIDTYENDKLYNSRMISYNYTE